MKSIDRRVMKIEASRGIKSLPDFERMTPEQMEAWCSEEATAEDMNQVYKKLMATVRVRAIKTALGAKRTRFRPSAITSPSFSYLPCSYQ